MGEIEMPKNTKKENKKEQTDKKEVKNEELLYLMIHINRIIEKEKIKKETSIHE